MKEKPPVLKRLIWLWRRLRGIIWMFLRSEVGRKALGMGLTLFAFLLCINGLNVLNSFVARYFMSAIENRDMATFTHYALMYGVVFALSTLVAVYFRLAEERLGLLWRKWLTRRVLDYYLVNKAYYHLNRTGAIANPDQRMTDDIRALTTSTLSFGLMVLSGTITTISFSSVLWSISPPLFVVAILYAATGSCFTVWLGRPLIRLNYRQSDREANFRTELIQVREHADALALIKGESRMRRHLIHGLDEIAGNMQQIITVNRNLNFFTTSYNYLIQLIPILLVAPLFIEGKADFGIISQSAMAFSTLLGAFSLIVTQFQSISSYTSVVARVAELLDATENVSTTAIKSKIAFRCNESLVAYQNLTLTGDPPENRVVLKDLTISIPRGLKVMMTGENSLALSTLMRATAGLVRPNAGLIIRPSINKLAFLAERPYIPIGTLREFLVPAKSAVKISDREISEILKALGLESAVAQVGGLETEHLWANEFSFHDQQALAVARLLLTKPHFAFLEHLHAAFSAAYLAKIHRLFQTYEITCISISNGDENPSGYDAILDLKEDGSWTWQDLHLTSPPAVNLSSVTIPSPKA
jgi:putative ATP-binding cassette transporter